MTAQPTGNYTDSIALGNVTVLGVTGQVSNVTLNGQSVTDGWSWNGATQILSITGLNNLTSNGTWNSNWELQWSVSGSGNSSGPSNSSSGSSGQTGGDGQSTATGGSGYVLVPVATMIAMLVGALVML